MDCLTWIVLGYLAGLLLVLRFLRFSKQNDEQG
jgi:hypothetical protein